MPDVHNLAQGAKLIIIGGDASALSVKHQHTECVRDVFKVAVVVV